VIERYGVRGTEVDGVFFTEGNIAGARLTRHIKVEIARQNSNLVEVKRKMASQAAAAGTSVIMNFRYGQKKHQWWELLLLKWDTESWHGEGDAVAL
jgi:hypothetical protein